MFKYKIEGYYFMTMKTLTIKEKVYKDLLSVKEGGESFSDLLERLATKEKKSITEFAGFLSGKTSLAMLQNSKKLRARTKFDEEREKRLASRW